jgi:3-dehydroquinate synthetase
MRFGVPAIYLTSRIPRRTLTFSSTVILTLHSSAYILITDTNVAKHHLSTLEAEFHSALSVTQPNGANANSRFLSLVLPPGNGVIVVGDLVGFVAATFHTTRH